jgi:23S rRNA pseudouridine1911/1915/1917 synthase
MSRPELRDGTHRLPDDHPAGALDRALRALFPGVSWNQIRNAIRSGKVFVDDSAVREPTARVAGGSQIRIAQRAPRGGSRRLPAGAILHLDRDVVVVSKPSGISTVPYEDEPISLTALVRDAIAKREGRGDALGVVQRLDKETSGVLVFTRTLRAKRILQQQFRKRTIERRYLALARGTVKNATFRSRIVPDRGDGRSGSTRHPKLGREAVTHVELLEQLRGASLIACRLETGRRHQIRIHLAEAGHPLLGERVYAQKSGAARIMLHAARLGFDHPHDGRRMHFEVPMPDDMRELYESLRRR